MVTGVPPTAADPTLTATVFFGEPSLVTVTCTLTSFSTRAPPPRTSCPTELMPSSTRLDPSSRASLRAVSPLTPSGVPAAGMG